MNVRQGNHIFYISYSCNLGGFDHFEHGYKLFLDMNIVRQSKFRHVFCKPIKHEQCMAGIQITEITWDSLFCAVNPKFIAIINKGAGGPFLVIPVNKVGVLWYQKQGCS